MLASITAVLITSQYINLSNQHTVLLKVANAFGQLMSQPINKNRMGYWKSHTPLSPRSPPSA